MTWIVNTQIGKVQSSQPKKGDIHMSGHSKWNNIKGKKGVADSKRSKVFSELSKQIRSAVKEGGSGDPGANPGLRTILDKARAANMPKENIQRAIDRGLGKTAAGVQIQDILYEAFGQFGEAYLVQAVTDNPNRTASEMRFIFTRHQGSLAGPNSAQHLFERRPDNTFVPKMPIPVSADQLELIQELIDLLIEHDDVEDVFVSIQAE